MAAPKNTNVYLEAVEEAENEGDKPKEVRNARMAGLPKRKYPKRLLGCCRKWDTEPHHNTNERLARRGYYDISEAYKSMHSI